MTMFRLALLAVCLTACLLPTAPARADGLDGARGTAVAGIDVRNLRLTRGDGTPFADTDFASATLSSNGNLFATANGSDLFRYVFPALERDSFLCAGEACPTPPVPMAGAQTPSGDTAYSQIRVQNWGGLQHQDGAAQILAASSFNDRSSLSTAFVDATFRFVLRESADLTWSLDASAFALAQVDADAAAVAKATLIFDIFLTDLTTGDTVLLEEPAALNRRLEALAGEAAEYASGPLHLTFAAPNLQAGHDYRLAFNQISTAEVPEPRMAVLLAAGLLLLALPRSRAGGRRVRRIMQACAALAVLVAGPAWADGSATAILQVHAPLLTRADGSLLTPADFTLLNTYSAGSLQTVAEGQYNLTGGSNNQEAYTEHAICSGQSCPLFPVGFPPRGPQRLDTGDLGYAERNSFGMQTLLRPDASEDVRADSSVNRSIQPSTGHSSGYVEIVFRPAFDGPLAFSVEATPYLSAVLGAPEGYTSLANARVRFTFEIWDGEIAGNLLSLAPPELNRNLVLTANGALDYAPGTLAFSGRTPALQADHLYYLRLDQAALTEVSSIPEPAAWGMLAAGLPLLAVRRLRGRGQLQRRQRPRRAGFWPAAMVALVWSCCCPAWAGVGANASIEISTFQLTHPDGTPFALDDFVPARAPRGDIVGRLYTIWGPSGNESSTIAQGPLQHARLCLPADCSFGFHGDYALASHDARNLASPVEHADQATVATVSVLDQELSGSASSTSLLTLPFQLTQAGQIAFDFAGRPVAVLAITPEDSGPGSRASVTLVFQLWVDDATTGQEVFRLAPEALNQSLALDWPDTLATVDPLTVRYQAVTPLLEPSHVYTLHIDQQALAEATRVAADAPIPGVPEPSSAAWYLAGLAMWAVRWAVLRHGSSTPLRCSCSA